MDAENPVTNPVTTPPVVPAADHVVPPAADHVVPPATGPTVNAVTMTLEEYRKTQERLAELDHRLAEEARKAKEAAENAFQRQLEKGEVTKALEAFKNTRDQDVANARREELAKAQADRARYEAELKRSADERAAAENRARATDQRVRKATKDRDLAQALAGHNLVPGGAEQLARLWEGDFVVQEEGEGYATRATNNQSVADYVAAQLATPAYAHFVRATTPGRGGTLGGSTSAAFTPPPAIPSAPEAPTWKNLGEQVLSMTTVVHGNGAAAASDISQGFGLRPAARA